MNISLKESDKLEDKGQVEIIFLKKKKEKMWR